jgi:rubrerythrin
MNMNLVMCEKCGTIYSNGWCPSCRKVKVEKRDESQKDLLMKPLRNIKILEKNKY